MRLGFSRSILLIALLTVAGCSDYANRWRNPPSSFAGKDLFEGSYFGKWESSRYRNTSGKLWCVLLRDRENQDQYLAAFRATWHGIFASEHTVRLKIKERRRENGESVAVFEGAMEIKMWVGSGQYRCSGKLTPSSLHAVYDAAYDRGTFTMDLAHRPAPAIPIRAAGSFEQRRH
jgi:hypothetical protein